MLLVLCFIGTVVTLPINCSPYKNDKDILFTLGFSVPLKPYQIEYDTTSAVLDRNDHVTELSIHHEVYISTHVFCLKHLQSLYILNSSFYRSKPNDISLYTIPMEIDQLASTFQSRSLNETPISYLPNEFYQTNSIGVSFY